MTITIQTVIHNEVEVPDEIRIDEDGEPLEGADLTDAIWEYLFEEDLAPSWIDGEPLDGQELLLDGEVL